MIKSIAAAATIAVAVSLAALAASCSAPGTTQDGGVTRSLPSIEVSGTDARGQPLEYELAGGTVTKADADTESPALAVVGENAPDRAFAAILEGELRKRMDGSGLTDEAFDQALSAARSSYAAGLVPASKAINDGVANYADKTQYFDAFVGRALSGDINLYYTGIGHASIWDARRRMFLHSGGETTLSNGTHMKAGAEYYDRNTIQALVGNFECRMMRVKYSGNRDLVSDAISSVYSAAKDLGYAIHGGRDSMVGGTYCTQIPYLVWKRLGVDIADGKIVYDAVQVLDHYVTVTTYFLWWSWQTQQPVYRTEMRPRFQPFTYVSGFDFVDANYILEDDSTQEILRSK